MTAQEFNILKNPIFIVYKFGCDKIIITFAPSIEGA
jgi:hypothetical protein